MRIAQSMFKLGTTTLVQVPLSVGKARQQTGTYAWTPGTLTFTGLTTKGAALPPVVAQGSFNLNAQGGGTVTLVSPSKVSIDGVLAQRRTVGVTKLVMSFVPEPGALLLLGAGALGLLRIGTRRPK